MKTLVNREDLIFSPPQLGCVLYLTGLPGANSKTQDRSRYGNHGTITGATWVRLPSGLWCLSFDGADGSDDFVSLGTPASLDITGDISILAWVNFSEIGGTQIIFSKTASMTSNGYYMYISSTGKFAYYTNQGATYRYTDTGDGFLNIGAWQLLAVTRSGAAANLYRNGVDFTVTHGTHLDPTPSGQTAYLGGWSSGYGTARGMIALPRIYNRVFSAHEIQNSFNREKHLFGVWQ